MAASERSLVRTSAPENQLAVIAELQVPRFSGIVRRRSWRCAAVPGHRAVGTINGEAVMYSRPGSRVRGCR